VIWIATTTKGAFERIGEIGNLPENSRQPRSAHALPAKSTLVKLSAQPSPRSSHKKRARGEGKQNNRNEEIYHWGNDPLRQIKIARTVARQNTDEHESDKYSRPFKKIMRCLGGLLQQVITLLSFIRA
jgi:hypothetical protein